MSLLKIENLKVYFPTKEGIVKANDGIDLELKEKEVLGLIGETGSGKTVLGMAIMRLLPDNARVSGRIIYNGKNLLELSNEEMRQIRGREIGMMLQNPSTSLNPLLSIGEQIAEVYRYHYQDSKEKARRKTQNMLESLGIDPKRINEYPHQFSGGMRQRIMISIGLALNPRILIADEPTKGLDVDVKKQILDLMKKLIKDRGVLLITHDIDAAEKLCDRIAVMYAGEIVEVASAEKILNEPKHPYTQGLLNSLPKRGLKPIDGASPSLSSPPDGCRFHPRCKYNNGCSKKHPYLVNIKDYQVRCFLYENGNNKS